MAAKISALSSLASKQRWLRRGGISFWRGLLISAVSIFVAVLIAISLWVSISAIIEKVNVSRGMNQVIDVVDWARRIGAAEHDYGITGREDILVRLARMEQIKPTEGSREGLSTLVNPWGGTLTAVTAGGNLFRVETVVPSRVCKRLVSLVMENANSFGLQRIDAKGSDEASREIFTNGMRKDVGRDEIAAGCQSDQLVILDLFFALR